MLALEIHNHIQRNANINGDGCGIGLKTFFFFSSLLLLLPSFLIKDMQELISLMIHILSSSTRYIHISHPLMQHFPHDLSFQLLPAWNNRNLFRLADRLRSHLFFGHVRAASPGSSISEVNTHPFQFGSLMWMHNGNLLQMQRSKLISHTGGIAKFSGIRRKLLSQLHAKSANVIAGTTDSEHAGALFVGVQVGMSE